MLGTTASQSNSSRVGIAMGEMPNAVVASALNGMSRPLSDIVARADGCMFALRAALPNVVFDAAFPISAWYIRQ